MTLKPGLGSLKVIEHDTIQSGTHDFLLTFHINHWLSRTVSEIDADLRRKSHENRQFFPPHVYLTPPGTRYRRKGQKKLELWGYQTVEKVLI